MRNIILIILIILFYFLIKSFFAPQKPPPRKREGGLGIDDEMVKDPNCETYIPKRESIEKRIKGETYFFCSRECFEEFKKKLESP